MARGRTVLVQIPVEVSEGDAFTIFKSMRTTMKAEKVEMLTLPIEKGEDGKVKGHPKCRVTGQFWAEVIADMGELEQEVADEQGNH